MARSDLEKEMIEKAGNEVARSINQEVLWGMLEGLGWTRVMITRLEDNEHAVDITHWLDDKSNIKQAYERSGRDFLFESVKDANWFKMRWGCL
jgi:hypothetical protein